MTSRTGRCSPSPGRPTQEKAAGQHDRTIFYQSRADRARRTLRGIDEQIGKAEQAVAGKASVKRNRFVTLIGGDQAVNRDLKVAFASDLTLSEEVEQVRIAGGLLGQVGVAGREGRGKLLMAVPDRSCRRVVMWWVRTLRLQPLLMACCAYHNRRSADGSFSSRAIWWYQVSCARRPCTTDGSGHAAAKARMYFRRDNRAADPESTVLRRGGSPASELVDLDVPWRSRPV